MKYFTKEVKIGLTGIIAIAALFIGLNFLKGINLFKPKNSYYIEFADVKGRPNRHRYSPTDMA